MQSELPKANADGWITIFDGKVLRGAKVDASALEKHAVRMENDTLLVENYYFTVPLPHKNAAVRFTGMPKGQNIMLRVRHNSQSKEGYGGWFNGGGSANAGLGIFKPGFTAVESTAPRFDNSKFFDGELRMVGNLQTLVRLGETILSTTDQRLTSGDAIAIGAGNAIAHFKRIEIHLDPASLPVTSPAKGDTTVARIEEALAEWRKQPEWNSHENGKRITKDESSGRYIVALNNLPVRDTSPFRALGGIPFNTISFGGVWPASGPASIDLSPLSGLDLWNLSLGYGEIRVANLHALKGSKLRSITGSFDTIEGAEGMRLFSLNLYRSNIPDLEPLRGGKTLTGMYLVDLWKLRDLSPLSTHPLTHLAIGNIQISSLDDLKTCPLQRVHLDNLKQLRDINALRGKSLITFSLRGCPLVTDLTPLLGNPKLEWLRVDGYPAYMEPLRGMKIKTINYKPAADYWAEWDKAKK